MLGPTLTVLEIPRGCNLRQDGIDIRLNFQPRREPPALIIVFSRSTWAYMQLMKAGGGHCIARD